MLELALTFLAVVVIYLHSLQFYESPSNALGLAAITLPAAGLFVDRVSQVLIIDARIFVVEPVGLPFSDPKYWFGGVSRTVNLEFRGC